MKTKNGNPDGARLFATQSSLDSYVWGICNILRRSNCAGALQYVPELTWILFLRILDDNETLEAERAEAVGAPFIPSLESPYRWQDWAAPDGWKRKELANGALGAFFGFVNGELLPYLKGLRDRPNAASRQKMISEILSGVEHVRVDTEKNFLDVLDKVHDIRRENIDTTHIFSLSQVYEGLLLKMGEKGNDGGQFFTPRQIIRVMVRAVNPEPGQTIYDPGCGTGGFLAQSYEYLDNILKHGNATPDQIEALKTRTFYGREKENLIYPIALANLVLHGIDDPHIWHGNTLTGQETFGGLFLGVPTLFDVVLTNPPFGGKEGKEAQTRFAYKTGATQVLFLQHVIDSLRPGGTCGIVLDEGVLFRNNETAFVQTKRKLLDDCDVWAIVSLPGGVFTAAGAGVKTNLIFFTKGTPTERIWYYDLSDIKVGKKTPLTTDRFDDFFTLLPIRADSPRSWTVTREEIEARNYDLKAVNPNAKVEEDLRTPEELLELIETKGKEVAEALARLRGVPVKIIFPSTCLLGAIAGDVIGSVYEYDAPKSTMFEMFTENSQITDDSILTLAVTDAILNGRSYLDSIREYALEYPNSGYGGMFRRWMHAESPLPYNSFGNGSAMRVSSVGWAFNTVEDVLREAEASAAVTHNHPEGIKGAQAVALAIFRARNGSTKDEIREETTQRFGYDLSSSLDEIRPSYHFDETCQKTVPPAIIAFLESENFEDAVRMAISLGGDADTLAAITGSIAEAFYGGVPEEIVKEVQARVPEKLWDIVKRFSQKYAGHSG